MNAQDTRYNGWANYETWCLALWIGNDEGSQGYWDEHARDCYAAADNPDSDGLTRRQKATLALSKMIQQETEDGAPGEISGFYADILTAGIQQVNWYEIAEHLLESVVSEAATS